LLENFSDEIEIHKIGTVQLTTSWATDLQKVRREQLSSAFRRSSHMKVRLRAAVDSSTAAADRQFNLGPML
jgi:cell division inhibitor SulA